MNKTISDLVGALKNAEKALSNLVIVCGVDSAFGREADAIREALYRRRVTIKHLDRKKRKV